MHAARRAAGVARAGIVIVAGDGIANAPPTAALGSAQGAVAAGRVVGFRRHSFVELLAAWSETEIAVVATRPTKTRAVTFG